jgi:ribosome biogenesis GTPase / thiamine phosphate phosphatase
MLTEWGWDDAWASLLATSERLDESPQVGRVSGQERDRWVIQLEKATVVGRIIGSPKGPFPVTGDWVVVRPGPSATDPMSIVAVLPRRSTMSRGRAGDGATAQVLAANIDVIWIVEGLDSDPNLRRVERFLAVAWESGATPEIVLTKADLSSNPAKAIVAFKSAAIGVKIHLVSVKDPTSVETLRAHLTPGRTVALVGPSGVGKSALINALAGEALAITEDVRESDRKGRHTTTSRELFPLPGGALLMDTHQLTIPAGVEPGAPTTHQVIKCLLANACATVSALCATRVPFEDFGQ